MPENFLRVQPAQKALLRMTTAQTSLEEIFLELTAEAPVGPAARGRAAAGRRGGRRMKAVFRHELSSYFTGMTGYVFGAFLLLFAGIYTMAVNLNARLSEL